MSSKNSRGKRTTAVSEPCSHSVLTGHVEYLFIPYTHPSPVVRPGCSESGPGPHKLHRRPKLAYNLSVNKEGEVAQDDLVQDVS